MFFIQLSKFLTCERSVINDLPSEQSSKTTLVHERMKKVLESGLANYDYNATAPPPLFFPKDLSYNTWLLGIEYKNVVFAKGGIERQTTINKFNFTEVKIPRVRPVKKYLQTMMYQNNYPGTWDQMFGYNLLSQLMPGFFDGGSLISFIINLLPGTLVSHPYKFIDRYYYVGDRKLITGQLLQAKQEVINTLADNNKNYVYTEYSYLNADKSLTPSLIVQKTFAGAGSEENTSTTRNYFAFENSLESGIYTGGLLSYLNDVIHYNSPLYSHELINGTVVTKNITSIDLVGGKIAPQKNYELKEGILKEMGEFTSWNEDAKPTTYIMKDFNGGSLPPITLVWNKQLQLKKREYANFATHNGYTDYFELKENINPDGIKTEFEYDDRGRLEYQSTLEGKQKVTYN